MRIAVVSLNKKGDIIAENIAKGIQVDLYSKTKIEDFNINSITKELMKKYGALVFLSSTGIAVRSISQYIKSKDVDPAVIVIDVLGKYVISLLSGHLGGANDLSLKLSDLLGAVPIITTATDILNVKAPDIIALENNLIIDNLKDAKEISSLLVDGKKVAFMDEKNKIDLPEGYLELSLEKNNISLENFQGIVYVTNKTNVHDLSKSKYDNLKKLRLIRKDMVLGIGCKKDYPVEKMIEQVCAKLEELNIDKRAVKYVATVEIKKDEKAILELNKFLKADLKIFTREDIRKVQHKYKGSDFVEKSIGIRAVCEPCVELCKAALLTEKIRLSGMTLCIGKI
ncbi:cobalt-precorrin 5A hydrolase [Clostridium arbusti]|uniref:cobalt-precorrin 5A hydrolase n=1 Tax=Clostridium arbusti TaxID=1137848 RepID=UPI0002897344|nr:cobalt-precorrin 5A hydrolase [Clostridium arbusti]